MRTLALVLVSGLLAARAAAEDKPARKLNITVSKETTYVTGPLDKEGYVDYAAALNERLGKGVTPETNANVLIWKALGPRAQGGKPTPAKVFKLMGIEEPPEKGDYFIELRPFLRDRLGIEDREQLDAIDGQSYTLTHQPWTATDHPQVADWLKANEKPLNLILEALKRPHYFAPVYRAGDKPTADLVAALLANTQAARTLTTALAVRGMLRVGDGKPADAWPDLLACQRIGRYVARRGSLLDALVGFACESIGQHATATLLERPELDGRQLAGFLRDLRALPPMPTVADHLDGGERFVVLDNITISIRGGSATVKALTGGVADLPEDAEIEWDRALGNVNRHFDRMAAALRQKDRDKRQAEFDRISADLSELQKARRTAVDKTGKDPLAEATPRDRGEAMGDILITPLVPAVRNIQAAYDHTEQGTRNLQVGLAIAGYQREHGTYPKAIDALAPKYLDKVPDDLFTGKPLVYRPSKDGYLLYSLGPNGKDDEGRFMRDDPPGDDIAIRVPVPKPQKN